MVSFQRTLTEEILDDQLRRDLARIRQEGAHGVTRSVPLMREDLLLNDE